MKVISSNLPKGRFETCPYPVLLPLHGVVKANWYNYDFAKRERALQGVGLSSMRFHPIGG